MPAASSSSRAGRGWGGARRSLTVGGPSALGPRRLNRMGLEEPPPGSVSTVAAAGPLCMDTSLSGPELCRQGPPWLRAGLPTRSCRVSPSGEGPSGLCRTVSNDCDLCPLGPYPKTAPGTHNVHPAGAKGPSAEASRGPDSTSSPALGAGSALLPTSGGCGGDGLSPEAGGARPG